MNKKIWIKLYLEILDDPKMGRLPDHLWRLAVELFMLAGKTGNDGNLPPVAEMAWALRADEGELLGDLRSLSEVGILYVTDDGTWFVTHFQERQVSESFERLKRYRERYSN